MHPVLEPVGTDVLHKHGEVVRLGLYGDGFVEHSAQQGIDRLGADVCSSIDEGPAMALRNMLPENSQGTLEIVTLPVTSQQHAGRDHIVRRVEQQHMIRHLVDQL